MSLAIGLLKQRDSDGFLYLAAYLVKFEGTEPFRVSRLDREFRECETYRAAEVYRNLVKDVLPVVCLLD